MYVPKLLACGLAAALVSLAGCSEGPTIVPVSGKVEIDGKPLTTGTVMFVPENERAAMGDIQPDGTFKLTTYEKGDGCVVGTHTVTVFACETLSPSTQKWHAPKEYRETETSGLKETIEGPRDDVVIQLTWNGGKPFIENAAGEGDPSLTAGAK